MSESDHLRSISYKPELDGLRGIAVILVILYHFKISFPGGYVGVDIFFVLSGYLITSIILLQIENGEFSVRRFMIRRLRRIFPPLVPVIILSLSCGWLFLNAHSFNKLSSSALAQIFFNANSYFYYTQNYFSESSELHPLLHCWSLSIEEQFYLIFPLLFIFRHKVWLKSIPIFLFIVFLVSLLLSIMFTERSYAFSFYMIPTRAWELLMGCLIAYHATIHTARSHSSYNIIPFLGLLLIFYSAVAFDSNTPFPGWKAIITTLGTGACLFSSYNNSHFFNQILSIKPLRLAGVISYSLYLWHWPIYSLSKHLFIEDTILITSVMIFLTLCLACASYRYLENPIREGKIFKSSKFLILSSLLVMVSICSLSIVIHINSGFPERFTDKELQLQNDIFSKDFLQTTSPKKKNPLTFAVLGDSHAMMSFGIFSKIADEFNASGLYFAESATIPIPGIFNASWPQSLRETKDQRITGVFNQIKENKNIKHVILFCRWMVYCGGYHPASKSTDFFIHDLHSTETNRAEALKALKRQLIKLSASLANSDIKLWIISQIPEIDDPTPALSHYLSIRFPKINSYTRYATTLNEHQISTQTLKSVWSAAENVGISIVNPSPYFYKNNNENLVVSTDRSLYRDSNHLTVTGAEYYLKDMIYGILKSIAQNNQP